ncbi:MAG: peptidoglycan DD-metalloendopeptidase family protein [Prevotellaceae bacterium]|jgi:septal ring factor EnvC (AmiA/AmiB activator)|nr:peptidoglycan DD-metalloendopeptidase family protein [Prevotellaceae bacterium]
MHKKIFFTFLILIFGICSISSQTIKDLEAQKKKAQEKLSLTQKMLEQTKQSKKGTEKEINLLTRSIEQTSQLIFSINSELDGLTRDITNLQTEKINLTARLEILKKDYAKMVSINEIYRKQFSPSLFVFSSKSFVQGYRRMRYLQQMSEYRKNQSLEIKILTQNISEKENLLHTYVIQKSHSLQQREQENQQLSQKKEEKNQLLKNYSSKEKDLKNTIAEEEKRTKQLNSLIQKKVADENRRKAELAKKAEEERKRKEKAKDKPAKTESTTPTKTEKSLVTDAEYKKYQEDRTLTGNFEKNRGNLPMPVESGKIYRQFGRQTNPNTSATEDNNGIYILAPTGTDARAVFDGTVFEVMYEPGSGYVIWITHGTYSTVYAQLSLFYVKKGDKVKAKQSIGKIAVKNNKTELNFYILNQNATYENPVVWLNN